EDKATDGLKKLQEKWDTKYPLAVRSWVNQWEHVKTFFKYPQEIRTVIYTTNAVELLHRQFRKVTKNRAVFPNEDALLKLLYLAVSGLSEKWTIQLHGGNRLCPNLLSCLKTGWKNRGSLAEFTQFALHSLSL